MSINVFGYEAPFVRCPVLRRVFPNGTVIKICPFFYDDERNTEQLQMGPHS